MTIFENLVLIDFYVRRIRLEYSEWLILNNLVFSGYAKNKFNSSFFGDVTKETLRSLKMGFKWFSLDMVY